MKLKIEICMMQVHHEDEPGVSFPDGDTMWVGKPLEDFLMHLEVLGMDVDRGFTVDDGMPLNLYVVPETTG